MEYLLVKEKKIREFLKLLDPYEQVTIMCLVHPTKANRIYYRVGGLTREWVRMLLLEKANDNLWEWF